MPYIEELEARIESLIEPWKDTNRKRLFGGICHLLQGKMFCGVYKDCLILRLGPTAAEEALNRPHVSPFDITGRPTKGWIMVAPKGIRTNRETEAWLSAAREFAGSLPPK